VAAVAGNFDAALAEAYQLLHNFLSSGQACRQVSFL